MIFLIVFLVIIIAFVLFKILNTSDFGESSLLLEDEEYEQFCEEYNQAILEQDK